MLSEVMPGLQQLIREAHPRDKQARSRRERHPPQLCPCIRFRHCRVESKRGRMQRMKYALIGLLGVVLLFAQSGLAYTARSVVCSQTGKVVRVQCCCSVKDGKFVCNFTNKSFEKCCCESR